MSFLVNVRVTHLKLLVIKSMQNLSDRTIQGASSRSGIQYSVGAKMCFILHFFTIGVPFFTIGVPFTDQTGIPITGSNAVFIRELSYTFPVGNDFQVVVGPRVNFYGYFDTNRVCCKITIA
jgi:hypothetical protein